MGTLASTSQLFPRIIYIDIIPLLICEASDILEVKIKSVRWLVTLEANEVTNGALIWKMRKLGISLSSPKQKLRSGKMIYQASKFLTTDPKQFAHNSVC